MTNLVPEQRPDSNGKVVTRWVLPGSGPSSAPSIPAPRSFVDESEDEELCTPETLRAFHGFLKSRNELGWSYASPLLAHVSLMPDSLADDLMNEMYGNSSFSPLNKVAMAVRQIYDEYSMIAPSRRATVLRNLMSVVPAQDMLQNSTLTENLVDFGRGVFGDVDGYMTDYLFSEDESRVFASVAAVAAHIYGDPDSSYLEVKELHPLGFADVNGRVGLLSRRSVDLLLPHAGKIDVLRDELQKRGTLHPDVVQVVIEGGVFREGSL